MKRFHVRLPTGELRSGGAAFVEVWDAPPFYRPTVGLARLPGVTPMLNVGYKSASPLRPFAARFVKHIA